MERMKTAEAVRVTSLAELQKLGTDVPKAAFGDRTFERHMNPSAKVGGFVESTASVEGKVFIARHSLVLDKVEIRAKDGEAVHIMDHAIVGGETLVIQNAHISGNAEILGRSEIREHARIYGATKIVDSIVRGEGEVFGKARIIRSQIAGEAQILDNTEIVNSKVDGKAEIFQDAKVQDSQVHGTTLLRGKTIVSESSLTDAIMRDNATASNAEIHGATMSDNASIAGSRPFNIHLKGNIELGGRTSLRGDISVIGDGLNVIDKEFDAKENNIGFKTQEAIDRGMHQVT